jgi:hypothetical protein
MMTTEQLTAWGTIERATRLREIAEAKKARDAQQALRATQRAAEQRRLAAGLSIDESVRAIILAARAEAA